MISSRGFEGPLRIWATFFHSEPDGPPTIRGAQLSRDEGGPFEIGNQVLISSHRELLSTKAMVVNVAEKSEQDSGRHD